MLPPLPKQPSCVGHEARGIDAQIRLHRDEDGGPDAAGIQPVDRAEGRSGCICFSVHGSPAPVDATDFEVGLADPVIDCEERP